MSATKYHGLPPTVIERLETELTAVTAERDALREQWRTMACSQCAMLSSTVDRIADYCWERRGHFASEAAAKAFAGLIREGRYNGSSGGEAVRSK